jgi:perosamine synthetase
MNEKEFSWPIITNETEKAVIDQLHESISIYDNSGAIGRLEDSLKEYFGKKHSLLFNSGTSALFSMYMSANLQPGDEVICPAYTFFATVSPIFFTGAIPVLADCNKEGNIDPEEIKKRITDKTKAVVITHMWGLPCDMDEITKICKENDLLLFEDISHAFGATYKGKRVGTFGDVAACSLQGQKVLTGGEGGFIVTNNSNIFNKSLLLGHYNKRCKNEIPREDDLYEYSVTGMGLKLRIHPIAAAIASQQFKHIEEILEKRNENANQIIKELKDVDGLNVIEPGNDKTSSWYALIIKYNSKIPIEEFHKKLMDKGLKEMDIPGSTKPLNLLPMFQNPGKLFKSYEGKLNYKPGDFPNAEKFYSSILKMPVWSDDKDDQVVKKYIEGLKEQLK